MMKTILITASFISALLAITGEGSQSKIRFSDEIVAATLILEAGGEYHEGAMEAVNEIIVNRAAKRNLSEAMVCLQKYQFSCWNDKDAQAGISKAMKHPRWGEALRIVKSPTTNYTKGADHYHADYIKNPYWTKSMTVTTKIGLHIFYK
jgi:spore germination cell wall hydrolase CwlJ-like protein